MEIKLVILLTNRGKKQQRKLRIRFSLYRGTSYKKEVAWKINGEIMYSLINSSGTIWLSKWEKKNCIPAFCFLELSGIFFRVFLICSWLDL